MRAPRYLCSQLVQLGWPGGATTGNLEEIAEDGSVVECEDRLEPGWAVEMRCGEACFAGSVVEAEQHEFGCRVRIAFAPETQWSLERFRPAHLIDLVEVEKASKVTEPAA